ncbi:MAG: hypothetical protein WA823_16580 [Candidatus Acidiferrales bacterium]
MAVLISLVVALDVAVLFLSSNPRLWCAIVPVLIPLLTPFVIFKRTVVS